jgi:hypothetical protein
MVAKTATQIKDTIEAKTYPYAIRFYTYKPKYPIYPYIVVRKSQPESTRETITDVTKTNAFEITFAIRYTREQAKEEADQTTVENTIISALESQDFGATANFGEEKRWQRTPITSPIYGSQSTINVTITDMASQSGSGILGAEMTLAIQSGSTIKLLGLDQSEGAELASHKIDTGEIFRDFAGLERGAINITYESTNALDSEIATIRDSGDDKNITLTKKGTAKQYTVKFGNTTKRGQFDNIERATTSIYVQGTWT